MKLSVTNKVRLCLVVGIIMLLFQSNLFSQTKPVVFKVPDSNEPGDIILLYGGNLAKATTISIGRLEDGTLVEPRITTNKLPANAINQTSLQPVDESVKFSLPRNSQNGVFVGQVNSSNGKSNTFLLNTPELWFMQPTKLLPTLKQNEAAEGTEVQVVGKNFQLPKIDSKATVALKEIGSGKATIIPINKVERFSLWFNLPSTIKNGKYQLFVHNGFGGTEGWSQPIEISIKSPQYWSDKVFDVKQFGALGDDKTDDTKSIRDAIDATEKNGGGVVYFPWGVYRLTDWIKIPEKVTLRGENRDGTQLKWPVDEPKTVADISPVAIYGIAPFAVEKLTLIARKVETILLDISAVDKLPNELMHYMKPWGRTHDIFIRDVSFQHWLLASHPDRQALVSEEFNKLYWGNRAINFKTGNVTNLEVNNCLFEGGNNALYNYRNGRVTNNSFSNTMGYCWTLLGGGAHYSICTGNDINASASWGYARIGMKYVYSAHNISHNFVGGEREAMTLDISAMPTERGLTQYWGSPIAVTNEKGNTTLQFPPKKMINADGFSTGFIPGAYRDGVATIKALNGGSGANEKRRILDNTSDKIFLESPWNKPPDTVSRSGYIEMVSRSGVGGNSVNPHLQATWVGMPKEVKEKELVFANNVHFIPQEFEGKMAFILDGKGVAQYREIISNDSNSIQIDKPWDVIPDTKSSIGIWTLMRNMIVYKSEGYDCSAFAQLYGSYYDFTVDDCKVERNQGIWGQSGWFVNYRFNTVKYGTSYHTGIGQHGDNREKNLTYSFVGLTDGNLRITKGNSLFYSDSTHKPIFVDKVLGHNVAGGLGLLIKGNDLSYNQRIALPPEAVQAKKAAIRFKDAIIEGNTIEKSKVGVQIGVQCANTIVSGNKFTDVEVPYLLGNKESVLEVNK